MLTTKRTLVDFYQITKSDDPVTLEVIIGDAQNAVSTLRLGATKISSKDSGGDFTRSFKVELGKNSDLNNQTLNLTTIVHEISPSTTRTSVTIKLSGGKKKFESVMRTTVAAKGQVVNYFAQIGFFIPS